MDALKFTVSEHSRNIFQCWNLEINYFHMLQQIVYLAAILGTHKAQQTVTWSCGYFTTWREKQYLNRICFLTVFGSIDKRLLMFYDKFISKSISSGFISYTIFAWIVTYNLNIVYVSADPDISKYASDPHGKSRSFAIFPCKMLMISCYDPEGKDTAACKNCLRE